jgi:hypothetical protein
MRHKKFALNKVSDLDELHAVCACNIIGKLILQTKVLEKLKLLIPHEIVNPK